MAQSWDIFCRIIDNFGDIGVTWRLARQLATEHGKSVRMWIDDLPTAKRLIPALDPALSRQRIESVEICQWNDADAATPADVVIEAFACELPETYLQKMVGKKPMWVNLEYLSAEPWIADFHAQKSQHSTLPLTKHFFFPGFEQATGGLLREHDLLAQRDDFRHSAPKQQAFRDRFSIAADNALKVSLFCYPQAPIADLLRAFADTPRPVLCLVPESGIWPAINQALDTALKPGGSVRKGNLILLPLPFLSQDDYDRLLWLCDINFVRGEDSWVRAIWAGKPLVWQPYRQQENTHLQKLDAFLNVYCTGLETQAVAAVWACHADWSGEALPEAVWRQYVACLPMLARHAGSFAARLARETDLASKLVIFCGNPP